MLLRLALLMLCALCLATPPHAYAQEGTQRPVVNIGVVMDGPSAMSARVQTLLRDEIRELTQREFEVRWPEQHQIVADWSLTGVRDAVEQLLADDTVDLVITLGLLSSQYAATRGDLPRPVIAPVVADAVLQGLPQASGKSGVPNLNYLAIPSTFTRDLHAFQEMVGFDRVAVLTGVPLTDAISDMESRMRQAAAEIGVAVQVIRVEDTAASALAQLSGETQAVYLFPLLHLSAEEFDRLLAGLVERGLPSFSLLGEPEVERGVMAALNPDIFPRLTRRIALNMQRILLGDAPEALSVAFAAGERLIVNMRTARAIGFGPSIGTLLEAKLLNAEPERAARQLTLETAVQEGVVANLALAAQSRSVAAGAQDIRIARSVLRPQLDVSSTSLLIDQDRAQASLGSQAQYTLSGATTLTQVLFSEQARANVTVQQRLQEAREFDWESGRLDIALHAAEAYLNVLRAKTFERIQDDNLQVTRTNLELARVRRELGQARAGEVFRWESEIARNRQSRIDAFTQRRASEVALNQVLNRPLEEPFEAAETSLDDAALLTSRRIFLDYLTNIPSANRLRDFMVIEGLRGAPELQALGVGIAARQRILTSARRATWSPTIALQGQLTQNVAEAGEGTNGPALPPTIPTSIFPESSELSWNVGLNITLPLSQGGKRKAERAQAQEELTQLQIERDLAQQRIEQNVRTAMHFAGGSFASIREAEAAAEAAQKTLDLVMDAYGQGVVDAVDVLEAQNAALVTSEAAANTVYDFLIDLMRLERATGQFSFFRTPDEQAALLERVEAFMTNE